MLLAHRIALALETPLMQVFDAHPTTTTNSTRPVDVLTSPSVSQNSDVHKEMRHPEQAEEPTGSIFSSSWTEILTISHPMKTFLWY